MTPVRLDVVVKVKAREEERRQEALGRALSAAELARVELAKAQAQLRGGPTEGASAASFALAESARFRVLSQVERARRGLNEAAAAVDKARTAWEDAHRRTDVVRKVADSRRDEVVRERARLESRQLDELSVIRFRRSA